LRAQKISGKNREFKFIQLGHPTNATKRVSEEMQLHSYFPTADTFLSFSLFLP